MIDVKEKLNPSNKVTISSFIGNWATKMISGMFLSTPTSSAREFTKSKLRENNS
jgi:hypothetical protein